MKAMKIIGAVTALLFVTGCVDNFVSVEVLGAKPFEIVPAEEPGFVYCVTPAPGLPEQRAQGWMDTEVGLTFTQPFEFRNNMPSNDDVSSRRLDTNTITLSRVVVSYRGLASRDDITNALADRRTEVPMTGVIDSAGGRLTAPVTLIPANIGTILRDTIIEDQGSETIIATFYLEGRTNAGSTIRTGEIDFPITVANDTDLCDDGRCTCYVQ
jgi:hypothetical protein